MRRGAPDGNNNSGRAQPFARALRHALSAAGSDREKLIEIANALIVKAADGDLAAIREIADRLDGKPQQSTNLTINDRRGASDVDDDELANIATGRGDRAAETPSGEEGTSAVH